MVRVKPLPSSNKCITGIKKIKNAYKYYEIQCKTPLEIYYPGIFYLAMSPDDSWQSWIVVAHW